MALVANQVSVEFPGGYRLGPLELQLSSGQTYGLVGKNGAGKSTFFEIVTGNLDYHGQLSWGGKKVHPEAAELKKSIGYLPQRHKLPLWAAPFDIVRYVRGLQGLEAGKETIMELLSYWGCDQYAKKPLVTLSHGMRKRVSLTLAGMHKPQLMVLDEPFSGLDLLYITKLQDLIAARRADGLTTIFSTHVIPFLSELCDQLLLLVDGKLDSYPSWKSKTDQELSNDLKNIIGGES